MAVQVKFLIIILIVTHIFLTDRGEIMFLLLSGHPLGRVRYVSGLWKYTMDRISSDLKFDQENYMEDILSKLYYSDKI